jgi:hypothetical protein
VLTGWLCCPWVVYGRYYKLVLAQQQHHAWREEREERKGKEGRKGVKVARKEWKRRKEGWD